MPDLAETWLVVEDFCNHVRNRQAIASDILMQAEVHVKNFRRSLVNCRGESRPGYNFFRLLGIHRREVKTHSALLRDLLNPLGLHGQGNLFVRPILDIIYKKAGIEVIDANDDDAWSVETEVPFIYGRMDLVLTNERHLHNIVIENKIDAGDLLDQMLRYWQHQQNQKWNKRILVYLTLDGRKPSAVAFQSASKKLNAEIRSKLVRLSYHNDLAPLMKTLHDHIKSADVRFMIRNYAELIERM